MLDDLRNTANQEPPEENKPPLLGEEYAIRIPRNTRREFLGMTAPQRFILAIMILLMILVLSTFCLVATGKIWI